MPAATVTTPTVSDRRRWIALVVVCLGQLMIVLDATIVNVALPSIQRELRFTQANLTWVVDAYLIAFGSFLLLGGRLGDLVGRKRVFLGGLTLFTVASALCGFADAQGLLIGARFVQGLGGAVTSAVILAIVVTEFPQPDERAKAMSVYTFVAVGGGSIGLVLGGLLTQSIDWHWIFFINLPIGIAALVLGALLIGGLLGSSAARGLLVTGMFGAFFLGALYFEHVLGYSALQTGLAFLPQTVTVGVLSLGIMAALMRRFGAMRILVPGLVLMSAADDRDGRRARARRGPRLGARERLDADGGGGRVGRARRDRGAPHEDAARRRRRAGAR